MIHLIGFHTQGQPFDNAKDLSVSKMRFQALYEKQVDTIKIYNTTLMMVKNTKFNDYIEALPAYKFLNGWTHHFFKWKPYVIYEHLKEMNDNDILVYHDCDIISHREYENSIGQFRENIKNVMENQELVCSLDTLYGRNKEVIKEDVFLKFGDYRETQTLKTNRIFIRKNPKTLQFVYNWLTLCNTSLLLPNYNEKHTYSQALFNVLYYKYIELGELSYPNVFFKDDLFVKETIFFLDKPKPKPTTVEKVQDAFIEPPPEIVVPVRRMLQPHQSNRSISMTLIPIAKPPPAIVRKKPPSFFTLNKYR